jgi:hypothetical protein
MKKQIFQSVLTGAFIAAVAMLASSVSAGDIKGAQHLLYRPAVSNIAPAMTAKSHDCAKCQDVTKEVTVSSSKGAYQKTALVAEHTCPTCDTRIKTEGLGKAAHNVAVHTCASGTTPSCCQ